MSPAGLSRVISRHKLSGVDSCQLGGGRSQERGKEVGSREENRRGKQRKKRVEEGRGR